jgi:hypothetical protein
VTEFNGLSQLIHEEQSHILLWNICNVTLHSSNLYDNLKWREQYQVYLNAVFSHLSKYGQFGCTSFHQEMSNLWMLQHGNIVILKIRFLDVTKFTTLTPLSLLVSCELSFPVVGLKMSSLPTLALKSPNKIHLLVFHRTCPLYNYRTCKCICICYQIIHHVWQLTPSVRHRVYYPDLLVHTKQSMVCL